MLNTTLALDILSVDLTKPENSIFIPVNCVGVMGKGLALDFKNKYPDLFAQYNEICRLHYLRVGFPEVIYSNAALGSAVLFATKKHWQDKSELIWIKRGLLELAATNDLDYVRWRKQTHNIHIPKLGCGLGGLNWADVRPLIEQFAEMMPEHEVYLYE
jgi:O-acetyl-ADP-ribose deacetylase (regulator of RNase III)